MFKELRIAAGFKTRQSFADAVGIKKYTVDKWESGKSAPKTKKLREVAAVLKVSIEEVLNCFDNI